jgi:glycosyltransferase involved in cell wall biosynthesis
MQQSGVNISSSELSLDKILLSIVVPSYNEEEVLTEFHKRISEVLDSVPVNAEIIYVNDGSIDNSLTIMRNLRESDPRIAIIDLSRNFGKEIAMTAGLDHASGDAVVIIDADLQHPPELIPKMLTNWKDGYDIVYATMASRVGENVIKRAAKYAYYRLVRSISSVNIPENAGDYRLLSRKAVDSVKALKEKHRFMKGLFSWIGYPQISISYQPDRRHAGRTKWSFFDLWNLAIEGITSFTVVPLKMATYIGILTAFVAFAYAMYIIFKKLMFGEPVPGYPSIMVMILFLGGIQLITIGIIGEYLGRVFIETKQRPLYILKTYEPSNSSKER